MTKPITPAEVSKTKNESLPPEVIEAFNELIVEYWSGYSAAFTQKEAVRLITKKLNLNTSDKIYSKHWLDVEDIFRKAGWEVEYDKPGYNESYEATFQFKRRKNRNDSTI